MENLIKNRLRKAIDDKVFPGCVLGVIFKNGERKVYPMGRFTYENDSPSVKEDTIYDVASVTKAIPGSSILLKLIDEGKLEINDRLADYIPEFANYENKKDVLIKHLLTYTLDLDMSAMSSLKEKTANEITETVIGAPLKSLPGIKYAYSNPTAFLIGLVVEKITGKKLDESADEYFFKPLGMNRTTFHPEKFNKSEIAPTEMDDWRKRIIQREVHDESAFVLMENGPTAIAGLFSAVPDLLNFQEMLLNKGTYKEKTYFSPTIVEKMHTNQIEKDGDFAGLGWELNKPSFMGKHSHEQMMGKTGFTGCVVIIDPTRDVGFTLLSNRIWPKRPKDNSAINEVRRDIADIIFTGFVLH